MSMVCLHGIASGDKGPARSLSPTQPSHTLASPSPTQNPPPTCL